MLTSSGPTDSEVTIALLYPSLLGTYGDRGNAQVLARRLEWRGIPARVLEVDLDDDIPEQCDIYLLGGGEDEPQVLASAGLRDGETLRRVTDARAVVFAVCAGFQIVGHSFPGMDGRQHEGAGLLDVETRRSFAADGEPLPTRAVGDVVVEPDPALGLPPLLGYENHGGRTRPLPGAAGSPLGHVRAGIGNGTPDRAEGHVAGHVLATYLHGPVLAQNPALADLLLTWVHGALPTLDDQPEIERLRQVRLRALDAA